jgi:small subunit ribosomal protein S2
MSPFIFTKRQNIHVIDLEQTQSRLQEAMDFARQIAMNGGNILFLGSKKQARDIVKKAAESCGMPYIVGRWIGGVFTNFDTVSGLVNKMKKLEAEQKDGSWDKYKKSEQVAFSKEMNKLQEFVGGIREMTKLPKAIFVVDIKKEKTAIAEAAKKNIPIIAISDTNVNPDLVQYPIPANDDAMKDIELITNCIAGAIADAKKSAPAKAPVKEEDKK